MDEYVAMVSEIFGVMNILYPYRFRGQYKEADEWVRAKGLWAKSLKTRGLTREEMDYLLESLEGINRDQAPTLGEFISMLLDYRKRMSSLTTVSMVHEPISPNTIARFQEFKSMIKSKFGSTRA